MNRTAKQTKSWVAVAIIGVLVAAGVIATIMISQGKATDATPADTREVTMIATGDGGEISVIADTIEYADPAQEGTVAPVEEIAGDETCDHDLVQYDAIVQPARKAEVVLQEEGWYLPHDNQTRYETEDDARQAGRDAGLRGIDGQPYHTERIVEEQIVPAETVTVETCTICGYTHALNE